MWLLLQRGMNNSIPCATTSKLPHAMGLQTVLLAPIDMTATN